MTISRMRWFFLIPVLFLSLSGMSQDNAAGLLDKGYDLYEDGKYDEAIEVFEKAATVDPSDAEIFYLMGVCRSLKGNNEGALREYEKALKLNPQYAEVYYEIGYANFLRGNTKGALAAFNQAIEIKPDYPEAYLNRGSVKCMLGDKAGAKKDLAVAKKYGMSLPQVGCD